MRPTFAAVIVMGLGVPASLILVMIAETAWPFAAVYGIAVLLGLGVDALLALPKERVVVEFDWPAVLYIGDAGSMTLRFAPARWPRATEMQAHFDVGPDVVAPSVPDFVLARDAALEFEIPLIAERRGRAEIRALWLRWRGPFGLMTNRRVLTLDRAIPVTPNLGAVRAVAIKFFARDAQIGVKAQRERGGGSDFDALRDYESGLDHRSIDWKHSARHAKLVCKEFQTERNHNIVLAFDTGQLMSEPVAGIARLDHAINAGLQLAYVALKGGDRVGIAGFGAHLHVYMEPRGGLHRFAHVQHLAADLEYRHDETNFTLGLADLSSRLQRRSLIVLFTEFVDTLTAELMIDNLGWMARKHMILFLSLKDPGIEATIARRPTGIADMARAVIADEFQRDRLVVLERLRRMGIVCLDTEVENIGVGLINQYLNMKRREMI